MNKKLVGGLIWLNRRDSRLWARIRRVANGSVTFEVREQIHEGPEYMDANWGFRGTLKTLSVEEFEAQYVYYRPLNLEHELEVAKEHLATASELLIGNIGLDAEEAEKLVSLFAKAVLNEAAMRIECMEWDSGCCGTEADVAADEIRVELTAEEIEDLEG
jgi:hypothetical protein